MTVTRNIFAERNAVFGMGIGVPQVQSLAPTALIDFTRHLTPNYVSGTRASSATWFDANGALQTAVTDQLRYDHDPLTLRPRGLLVEGARTNLLLNSAVLSTQNITVTAVAHTLSFYGTGSITLSGVATGTLNGAGAFPNRAVLTFTPTAGTLTLTVSGTVELAQCEAGGAVSSYIPTTGAAATRAADVVQVLNLASVGLTPTEGTIFVDFEPGSQIGNETVLGLSAANSTADAIWFFREGGNANAFITTTGGTGGRISGPASGYGTARRVAVAYRNLDSCLSVNGTNYTNSTFNMPVGLDRLCLGNQNAVSTRALFGWIRYVHCYAPRMSNAHLIALTT